MTGLSPELKRLLPVYRSANLPTEADSARVIERLRARLGDAAITGAETSQPPNLVSNGLVFGKGVLIGLAGLAALSGFWSFAARQPPTVSRATNIMANAAATGFSTTSPSVTPSSEPPAPEIESSVSIGAAETRSAVNRDRVHPLASHRNRDRLAEEVALLARAQEALRNGRPAVALEVLKEHERKFGNGLLAEERIAAGAQALCALGRATEADAQLAQISPQSVLGQHSRQACGSR